MSLNEPGQQLATESVIYLSIDPGKSNGLCGYDENYFLLFMINVKSNEMIMFLQQFKNVRKCILEGFNLYPNKAKEQIYSDMETPRVIGRVESWCTIVGVELIKQPASVKPTGYKWIGERPLPKSNPKNHQMDAHVHFMYWAIRNGHINAATLVKDKK